MVRDIRTGSTTATGSGSLRTDRHLCVGRLLEAALIPPHLARIVERAADASRIPLTTISTEELREVEYLSRIFVVDRTHIQLDAYDQSPVSTARRRRSLRLRQTPVKSTQCSQKGSSTAPSSDHSCRTSTSSPHCLQCVMSRNRFSARLRMTGHFVTLLSFVYGYSVERHGAHHRT